MYQHRKLFAYPLRGLLLAAALLASAGSHASVVISEVFYDAVGADNGYTFVELFGVPGTLLDGMFLEGVNGNDGLIYRTIVLSGVIPVDGVFLIADDQGDGTSRVGGYDFLANADFQNGPDSIILRSVTGVLDAVGYGNFSSAVFAGEGNAAVDVSAGHSLARLNLQLDSNDNLTDFSDLSLPTPGVAAATAVPVPPAVILFMSGLIGLLGICRGSIGRRS